MSTQYISLPYSAAPTGGATAANQVLELAQLTSINAKLTAPLSVTGPLTDAQLRATAVPVSGSLTVSGTVTANQGTSPWITNGSGYTQPVSGTFFQATQPVSVLSLPLPSGASTDALQSAGNASLVSIDSKLTSPLTVTGSVTTGGLTDAQLRASAVPVSLTSTTITGSVAVTGPLTDTQLRLTPVPISGTVTTGGLTDTQLRLTPVPVSLTSTTVTGTVGVTQSGTWTVQPGNTANTTAWKVDGSAVTQPVSGTFFQSTQPVSIAASVAVTGPLTDTQLRLTPVPVSGTVAVTGPLTDTQLRATPVPVSGTVSTGGLTDTQLRATPVPVSGTVATGGLTDTQLRASAVPVSLTSTTVTGNVTVVQPTGTNLHTVIDSGTLTTVSTVTAVTGITNALPAGSNVIGHVITDSGSTTVVTGNVTVVQPTGTNLHIVVDSGTITANAGTFATASNTRVSVDNSSTVQLLAANANRKYAYIMNQTGNAMYLKLGASAVVAQGILLSNGGMYEITGENLWTGTVNAISSSPTASSLDVFEGTP